jgi:hypothetical protein
LRWTGVVGRHDARNIEMMARWRQRRARNRCWRRWCWPRDRRAGSAAAS